MIRKLITVLAVIALPLTMAAPAGATTPDTCSPSGNFCKIQEQAAAGWYMRGTTHDRPMIGISGYSNGDLYEWVPVIGEPGWYYWGNINNDYAMTVAWNATDQRYEIYPEGPRAGDTSQWFHNAPSGTGGWIIENYDHSTSYGVVCCVTSYSRLFLGNGYGAPEIWNFKS